MSIVESDASSSVDTEHNSTTCCNESHHKNQIIHLKLSGAASYPCLGSPRRSSGSPRSPSRGDLSPKELSGNDSCSGNRYKRLLFANSNNQSVRSGLSVILESQGDVGEE